MSGLVIGVIGVGNIGSTRARLLADHPAVERVLVHDIDPAATSSLAAELPGRVEVADPSRLVDDPALAGVIVATRAAQHAEPARLALARGLTVLIEKPFTGDPAIAQQLVDLAERHGAAIYAGYTQRFRRKFLNGFEQLRTGRLGAVRGIFARFHSTRAVARTTLAKSPSTRPVRVLGPHLYDLLCWYLHGALPTRVEARTVHADLVGAGQPAPATTWALLDYGDFLVDAVTSWQLPAEHPAYHASIHLEVIGSEGLLVIDDTHTDVLVSSRRPIVQIENAYTGASNHRAAFLGSYPPGDAALGTIHGPVRDETFAFVEAAATGTRHPILATGAEAVAVTRLVAAVDEAAHASVSAGPVAPAH